MNNSTQEIKTVTNLLNTYLYSDITNIILDYKLISEGYENWRILIGNVNNEFNRCKRNLNHNRIYNIKYQLPLQTIQDYDFNFSMSPASFKYYSKIINIEVKPIAYYLTKYNMEKFNFMKIMGWITGAFAVLAMLGIAMEGGNTDIYTAVLLAVMIIDGYLLITK